MKVQSVSPMSYQSKAFAINKEKKDVKNNNQLPSANYQLPLNNKNYHYNVGFTGTSIKNLVERIINQNCLDDLEMITARENSSGVIEFKIIKKTAAAKLSKLESELQNKYKDIIESIQNNYLDKHASLKEHTIVIKKGTPDIKINKNQAKEKEDFIDKLISTSNMDYIEAERLYSELRGKS